MRSDADLIRLHTALRKQAFEVTAPELIARTFGETPTTGTKIAGVVEAGVIRALRLHHERS